MVGFISAIPAKIDVKGTATDMVEINFLCVHKKLRYSKIATTPKPKPITPISDQSVLPQH